MSDLFARVKRLQLKILTGELVVIARPADIRYFTNFVCLNPEEREAFFVVSKQSAVLLYPSFSPVTKLKKISYHAGYWPSDLKNVAKKVIENEKIETCLIDAGSLFVTEYQALGELNCKLGSLDQSLIWRLRAVKSEEEIELLTKAGQLTAQVMERVFEQLAVGVSELEVAKQVEILLRQLGGDSAAFPPVIAFGAHSALPHHQPTGMKLKREMPVLIDIGVKFQGYCGDMTRTKWFGNKPRQKFLEIEQLVKQAYQAALTAVCGGQADRVDLVARQMIDQAGFGEHFIHTTGHGVGLEIHEQPSLYFKQPAQLPVDAVITIEPGVYFENDWGYRYENMVVVKNGGCRELTS